MRQIHFAAIAILVVSLAAGACGKKKPPVAGPLRPPTTTGGATPTAPRPPAPPDPVPETTRIPPEPKISDDADQRGPGCDQQELAVPAGLLPARQLRGGRH